MEITDTRIIKPMSFDQLDIGEVYCPDYDVSQYMLFCDKDRMVVLKTGVLFEREDFSEETIFWPLKTKLEVY